MTIAAVLIASLAIAAIPFQDNGKLVSVRARVNGFPALRLTLDTGASASVLDSDVAHSLRLRASGVHVGSGAGAGAVRYQIFRNVSFAASEVRWTAPVAYGISLRNVGTQEREDGLIGSDFFRRYVVSIDYRAHRLGIFRPSTFIYAGHGRAVPLFFAHHRPFVAVLVKVAGIPARRRNLLIDTGSEDMLDDGLIAQSTARTRLLSAGVGLGHRFASVYGPIQWASIAGYTIHNLNGVSGGVPLIGQSVLRHFVITLDYTHRLAYFELQR